MDAVISTMAEAMSVPYCSSESNRDLSTDTVVRILKDPEKDKPLCHFPAVNPKGGEVYLYSPKDKDAKS